MKLRIKGNSIRLRVTRPELDRLVSGGPVEEVVRFGPGDRGPQLVYTLRVGGASDAVTRATYDGGRVEVVLPPAAVERWRRPDEIGIAARQDLGGGAALSILVEKDFVCLDARPGDQDADAFPNPLAADGKTC